MAGEVRMAEFHYGDTKLDQEKCAVCGHPFNVHNLFNCTFAFEKVNECSCALGRATLEARYWAKHYKGERDAMKRVLDRPDVQSYLAWWNATRND
jgi:hypothetical protein